MKLIQLGKGGKDGDMTNTKNLQEFAKYMMKRTKNKGVHTCAADGVCF